jgi:hypothetical protein
MPKSLDGLLDFVFENLKVLLFKTVDGPAFFVENGNRQIHLKRFDTESVFLIFVLLLQLRFVLS